MAPDSSDRHSGLQRILRLTPLRGILALVDARVEPVKSRKYPTAATVGLTLADDVVTAERPTRPIALIDGFAVEAAAVADAGSYAPALLASLPQWVEAGETLPDGTDAVAPLDAVTQRGERVEVVVPVVTGQGVLPAGGDAGAQTLLRRTGQRMRDIDCAVAAAVGFAELSVREPRIWIARGGPDATPPIDAGLTMLTHCVGKAGCAVHGESTLLHDALARDEADAVIALGGTGSGRRDTAVQTLARLGRVDAHGIAISPGETAALGFVDKRPVLLIPGRLDAALAAWLLIGRQIVAKLSGEVVEDAPRMLPLRRKVASAIGMTEVVPVRCTDGMADPLASGYLSFTSLAQSDGWIVIPAESEGFPADTHVAVRPWF